MAAIVCQPGMTFQLEQTRLLGDVRHPLQHIVSARTAEAFSNNFFMFLSSCHSQKIRAQKATFRRKSRCSKVVGKMKFSIKFGASAKSWVGRGEKVISACLQHEMKPVCLFSRREFSFLAAQLFLHRASRQGSPEEQERRKKSLFSGGGEKGTRERESRESRLIKGNWSRSFSRSTGRASTSTLILSTQRWDGEACPWGTQSSDDYFTGNISTFEKGFLLSSQVPRESAFQHYQL